VLTETLVATRQLIASSGPKVLILTTVDLDGEQDTEAEGKADQSKADQNKADLKNAGERSRTRSATDVSA
jgi:hypothetical protein